MAPHAKFVPPDLRLRRVRIMAVQTRHTCRVHPARQERGEFVVLIPHLPIRMEDVRVVHDREQVVVPERIARRKIPREFAAPRVAGCTGLHVLGRSALDQRRVLLVDDLQEKTTGAAEGIDASLGSTGLDEFDIGWGFGGGERGVGRSLTVRAQRKEADHGGEDGQHRAREDQSGCSRAPGPAARSSCDHWWHGTPVSP